MNKTALVIMAAGIGSRYGGGIKQLEPVGCNNEIIMDFSIHDAIQAGFNHIIFIIRKEIEEDFRERIGNHVSMVCSKLNIPVEYCFQDVHDIPGTLPEGRTKPWGTCQAVLAARNLIRSPFAVINADDYYGKEAFRTVYSWLQQKHGDNEYCMAGFILKNTLSENGSVTRGICAVDAAHHVLDVTETRNIVINGDKVESDGVQLNPECHVSMNMWGFPAENGQAPAFLQVLSERMVQFMEHTVPADPMKSEFLLPVLIGEMLQCGEASVQLLETRDKWFGVTYKEDTDQVRQNIRQMIADGIYKETLYDDLTK
ncbi:MAG: nucleotidyltransferase [Oscillospiraceae bacterium]|nr:nucleotidyltransferase [Oscillospiraceae bacterium]